MPTRENSLKIEMERMEIEPGGTFTGVPHLAGSREYFHCVESTVEIRIEAEHYRVSKGGVLIFPGDRRHSYRNLGNRRALGMSVVLFGR